MVTTRKTTRNGYGCAAKRKPVGKFGGKRGDYKPLELTEGVTGSLISVFQSGHPVPDAKDIMLANKRLKMYEMDHKARIGDYIIMPNGNFDRFAHDWGDGLQTTKGGSFYLGDGFVSFSGGLNPTIPNANIKLTHQKKTGFFWIFHHNMHMADNSVGVKAWCRVYAAITGHHPVKR